MAELADAQDLGSCALRRMGSSPTDRNRFQSVDGFLLKIHWSVCPCGIRSLWKEDDRLFVLFSFLGENLRQINFKKGIDRQKGALYNCQCVLTEALDGHPFGVWLSLVERLVWDQEVAGSNPVTPTSTGYNYNIGNNYFYLAGVVQW